MTETTPAPAFEAALAVVNRADHRERIDTVIGHTTADATRRAIAELAVNGYEAAPTLAGRVRGVVVAIRPLVALVGLARDITLALDALRGTEPTELEQVAERVRTFLLARSSSPGNGETIYSFDGHDLIAADLNRLVRAVLPGAETRGEAPERVAVDWAAAHRAEADAITRGR